MNSRVLKLVKKVLLKSCFFVLICVSTKLHASEQNSSINIYYTRETGTINKKVFGNNFIGYDPVALGDCAKEYYGYSDYGSGVWDPKWSEPVKEVVDLAKEAGIAIIRFPGGNGSHHYNWKKTIGKKRDHFRYGIDEFLKTCTKIGAEPVITISYFTGNENDQADLVEYLNCFDDGSNPSSGIEWAKERSKNGHQQPYHVKYFEIGNEVDFSEHIKNLKKVSPEEYAKKYLKYYDAMKSVDHSIKIGAVLSLQAWHWEWNIKVLDIIKEKLDFGIVHTYPTPIWGKGIEQLNTDEIFKISLALPNVRDEFNLQETLKLLKQKAGKDVPLAITEYNGGFPKNEPIPYRHCLGTALLNAELLRIFMKSEHNILMANYWQFCNSSWGMIMSKDDFMKHDYRKPIIYFKKPSYFVYEFYHNHFGSILIASDINCGHYRIDDGFAKKYIHDAWNRLLKKGDNKGNISQDFQISYLTINASKDLQNSKVYLMVINKNLDESVAATINLHDFIPIRKGDAWILNGPGVDATNEKNPNNVKVKHVEFEVNDNKFIFTFEPHSLTAIECKKQK